MDHNKERITKERLQELIAGEDYRAADRVLREYLDQGGTYDDVVAIYDGYIGQSLGDGERTWTAIHQGLKFNPENYELYVMLGNYYLEENQEQSRLCYEHALACCHEQEDRAQIQELLGQMTQCGAVADPVSDENPAGRGGTNPAYARVPGAGKRRFLLFYAGNEKGYYQDTKYFTSEISRELGRRGHETFICDLARGTHDGAALEDYLAKGVDAVLTFNGEAIQKEELWQLWNQLGALVVNILMDPPFHMDLCPYLESPAMEQYLLLCPDGNHVDYVKRYYPQVKHVEFMPHAGTPVEKMPIPWKEKGLDLLFSGTYTRPEGFLDVMRQTMKPEDFRLYAGMGERILQETHLSVDQVVAETLFSDQRPVTPGRIRGAVTGMSLLDGWVRMVMRERVVTALVAGGVDLHVLGDGWQNCPCADSPHLHTLSRERIPLGDTLAWMENARICLNVMPWFKAGSHDRVFNAMLRGSVALTDPSSFFRKYFRDRESIVYYSLEELEKLPEIVRGLLAHPDQAEAIAWKGYEKAAAFTWENYVEELLGKVEKCLG